MAAALALWAIQAPIVEAPLWVLAAEAAAGGVMLSLLLLPMRGIANALFAVPFDKRQRIVNLAALAVLFTLCWTGAEHLIVYVMLPQEVFEDFVPLVPAKLVFSLLVYAIVMTAYNGRHSPRSEDDADFSVAEAVKPAANTAADRITVKTGSGRIEVVPFDQITHIEAEGDYVMIHTTSGRYLKEQTMKSLGEALPPDRFVRVHRSSIVNVAYLSQIELYDKQTRYIIMRSGDRIKASANGYANLKQTLNL